MWHRTQKSGYGAAFMPSDRGAGVLGEAGVWGGVCGAVIIGVLGATLARAFAGGERVEQRVGVQVTMVRTYGQISGTPAGRN